MWRLINSITRGDSAPALLGLRLKSPVVAISAQCLLPDSGEWVRAGWVRPTSQTPIGRVFGQSELLLFKGIQVIHFQVPSYPYDVEFSPRAWVGNWRLRVWERDLEDEAEPTPTLDLILQRLRDMEDKIDAL
jgi:hypothetical protein